MKPIAPVSVHVELGPRSYDISIGSGLLGEAESYRHFLLGRRCMIVSNDVVAPLYAARLASALRSAGVTAQTIVLPDGEDRKNWPTLQTLLDALVEARCDRDTVLLALGGGVTGDVAGFAAACYMRGVAHAQIPTTLLAQVDSSVGGKTGINHVRGKNLIGAFHQPVAVVADIDTLDSLPPREFRAGLAEVIKYGAVADDEFLIWLESHFPSLLVRDKRALVEAVARSCAIKAAVVASDERETGRRAILNFGHTFAHAIETGAGYGSWLHGEAVGCGMVMAGELSVRLGLVKRELTQRIDRLVAAAGLPVRPPPISADRFVTLMRSDKKVKANELRFVVLESAGRACVRSVAEDEVAGLIESFTN